jgi:hypothetical protein
MLARLYGSVAMPSPTCRYREAYTTTFTMLHVAVRIDRMPSVDLVGPPLEGLPEQNLWYLILESLFGPLLMDKRLLAVLHAKWGGARATLDAIVEATY